MENKVASMLGSDIASSIKYVIYSAHDDQLTSTRNFLGIEYDWIPYASTITFELKYSV